MIIYPIIIDYIIKMKIKIFNILAILKANLLYDNKL